MASRDIAKTISFSASTANYVGQTIEMTSCSALSMTVLVSVSANTLVGNVQLTATNDDARAYDLSSTLPALANGTVVAPGGALPTGITYTNGVLAFASPAIGVYEFSVSHPSFLKWARPVWTYSSGGGVTDVRVTVCTWSV